VSLVEVVNAIPLWLRIWWNILVFGVFFLPMLLLIWPETRRLAAVTVATSAVVGAIVYGMFLQLGYVRLLGLPHVIFWTPIAIWLIAQLRRADLPVWPRRIMGAILAVFLITLAFDYTDVVRYWLGERERLVSINS